MKCDRFTEKTCKRRDISPGACNKCPNSPGCRRNKYFYYASSANQEYKQDLVEYSSGINITIPEVKTLAEILKPLLN